MKWTIKIEANERDVEITVDDNCTTVEPIPPDPVEPPVPIPPPVNTLFHQDFEGYAEGHTLTLQEAAEAFNRPELANSTGAGAKTWEAGNGVIVNKFGKMLRSTHYKDMYGLGKSTVTAPKPSGLSTNINVPLHGETDFYVAMDLAVDSGWKAPQGIHLLSAKTDANETGSCCFQICGDVYTDHGPLLALYYYSYGDGKQKFRYFNPNDPTLSWANGNGPKEDYIPLRYDELMKLEYRVKLNTFTNGVSNTDGLMQAWFNGKLVIDVPVEWRDNEAVWFEFGQFQTWYGGNTQAWAARENQYLYFDNVTYSLHPITH